ncbi:DNA primase [Methanosphaera cuniculi]|uniref:DNA primase DnaG n=2 Tax=Methanosphaera cuniculi TaxID=1077256 RepID=A0A2V2BPX6_9EURY|nr:DNA primase DnaG [Methanosphaera cuniculi]PWL07603.1 DNA primase [Methanosphaera cuniculi]
MTHKNAKYFSDEDYYYMVKDEITTTKYLIHSQINAKGFVEKPDVVGAIFGQTEGLLSDSLDLRELQKTGRIGRIKVDMTNKAGRTKGEVIIPSSLDRVETTILAASLETINRVGPCEASLRITKIEDVRAVKRRTIVERAKELYQDMMEDFTPESSRMIEEVKESIRIPEIIEFGEDKLPAGPNTPDSDAILIVEGRSDVLNLLKYGIKNTIAVEGVNIPKTVADLTKDKTVTAFLDGDRGGDLILKELLQVGNIDYVTRAPRGQEVEYLDKDQVIYALKNKTSVDKLKNQVNYNHNHYRYNNKHSYNNDEKDTKVYDMKQPVSEYKTDEHPFKQKSPKTYKNEPEHHHIQQTTNHHKNTSEIQIHEKQKDNKKDTNNKKQHKKHENKQENTKNKPKKLNKYQKILNQLAHTNMGKLYDENFNELKEVPVEQIYDEIKITDDVKTVIFDGIISQRLVDISKEKNIEQLAAVKMSEVVKKPETIKIITKRQQQ